MQTGNNAVVRRQLVVLCDGTNNNLTGGKRDTHLVKLSELLAADPDTHRIVFYDPGVGNSGELPGATWWDKFRREQARVDGLAFGRGIYENMLECYRFLMQHYEPGDEIFIFGFSRGAFTARSVAGFVNQFGILRRHMESMLPNLLHAYFSDRKGESGEVVRAVAAQVSRHFADDDSRQVDIHFVGVWDTVASVGLPPFHTKITALPTLHGKSFLHVRQALALDEHRLQFKPRLYAGDNGRFKTGSMRDGSLVQLWFPGSHCDVGGGYELKDCELSDTAFAWLVSEAVSCGMRLRDGSGAPLASEEAVETRLHGVHGGLYAAPAQRVPVVQSQLQQNSLWAVTGMCVRDIDRVVMDDGTALKVKTGEHPSVGKLKLTMEQSAWTGARPPVLWWIAFVLFPLYLLALGQLLHGAPGMPTVSEDLLAALKSLGAYLGANEAFQRWQLIGWISKAWPAAAMSDPLSIASWFAVDRDSLVPAFESPRWALFWDLGFVACYATVLSWPAAWAFARIAGLRRLGHGPAPWLNMLGRALPVMVFCDLGENVMSWLALTAGLHDVVSMAIVTHMLAAVLSVGKFIGLLGVVALLLAYVLSRLLRRPRKPTPAGTTAGAES